MQSETSNTENNLLYIAANGKKESIKLFEALLINGVSPDLFLKEYHLPILTYTHNINNYNAFKILLKRGANPNAISNLDRSYPALLLLLIQRDSRRYLKELLKYKVDINVVHPVTGDSALMMCVTNHYLNFQVMDLLLKKGIKTDIVNNEGLTVFDMIDALTKTGYKEIALKAMNGTLYPPRTHKNATDSSDI